MSEAGVIPPPEERRHLGDPYIRHVGGVADSIGIRADLGVDYDTVSVTVGASQVLLTRDQAEEFAQYFIAACWEAGENKRRMDAETPP